MEEFMQTSDLNSGLINEIVCKVKSEGLFDQFRRECLADVDTKPAYQNLQNRVEASVCSFLEEQNWHAQLNKNQLREKLRKLVLEKKFFEAGIERIVDQVVNPKLNTNFVPKIEDVAYKFMGVERPSEMKLKLEIETDILPVYDLEQVSPDSSRSSNDPKLPSNVKNMESENYFMFDYSDAKLEDLESPAFEPIEPLKAEIKTSNNDDDMDISDSDTETPQQMNELKSNISSISGLTSNESNNSSNDFVGTSFGNMLHKNSENTKPSVYASNSSDLVIDQDYELSQVSSETSTSRLSIITNNITNSNEGSIKINDDCANAECFYGMSEETQMQKFNESSSSPDNFTESSTEKIPKSQVPQFNIKTENIKFEGTERMNMIKFMDIEDHFDVLNGESLKNSAVDRTDSAKKQSSNFKYKHQREQKSQSLSRTSKKDDHFTHKGKATARQRSHSKDSNDGFTLPNKTEHSNIQNINQSKSSNEQAYTECSNEAANVEPTTEQLLTNNITSHPVVIDQILIGNDLDLKSFIVENRDDPFVSNIEKDIISTKKKKPKVAENIFDAKRLIKVRKQIDLRYQKKIEQATVKAKQYIRTNVTNIRDECQGVELEFLCRDSPRFHEKPVENEMYAFKGFDCTEKNRAKVAHQTLFEKVNENCLKINTNPEDESKIILANVFISDACRRSESVEKHRQKTRYSNDDLFKPRPLLCGISKRRRGFFASSSSAL